MKEISLLCENDDMDGLVELLYDNGSNSMKTAMNLANGFMIAHKEMRDRHEDEAYKVLNNIHDKLQNDEEE
tara:strand:+ start:696 stop:908 length:213 start_codon:yes stop_codon:yes gene_type:complete